MMYGKDFKLALPLALHSRPQRVPHAQRIFLTSSSGAGLETQVTRRKYIARLHARAFPEAATSASPPMATDLKDGRKEDCSGLSLFYGMYQARGFGSWASGRRTSPATTVTLGLA